MIKKYLFFLIVLFVLPLNVTATDFDFYPSSGVGSTVDVGYAGEQTSVSFQLANKGKCAFECTLTSEISSPHTVYVDENYSTKEVSMMLTAPSLPPGAGTLEVNIKCVDKNCFFGTSAIKQFLIPVKWHYCGDGLRDSREQCDGSDIGENCKIRGADWYGTLRCGGNCQFDFSGCQQCPVRCSRESTTCFGNEVKKCKEDFNGCLDWLPEKTCGEGEACSNGDCRCAEGYAKCDYTGKCEKRGALGLNQKCGCDFQCAEGFCDNRLGQCVKGLNVQISASKPALEAGEEATVSLSVSNPLNSDVLADITLSLGDGVELSQVISGADCSGSQCKLNKINIREGGKKDVTITVRAGNSPANPVFSADVSYVFGGRSYDIEKQTKIAVNACGNAKIDEGENQQICCIDFGCPGDDQFYTYSCNRKTRACDKKPHAWLYFSLIATVVTVISLLLKAKTVKNYYITWREKRGVHKAIHQETKKEKSSETKKPEESNSIREAAEVVLDKKTDKIKTNEAETMEKQEQDTKFCNKCGHKLEGTEKFCRKCGNRL